MLRPGGAAVKHQGRAVRAKPGMTSVLLSRGLHRAFVRPPRGLPAALKPINIPDQHRFN
jgi:hypothetical protein